MKKILKIFGNHWRVELVFGKILKLLWPILYAVGQMLIAVNSPILKKLSNHLVTLPRIIIFVENLLLRHNRYTSEHGRLVQIECFFKKMGHSRPLFLYFCPGFEVHSLKISESFSATFSVKSVQMAYFG